MAIDYRPEMTHSDSSQFYLQRQFSQVASLQQQHLLVGPEWVMAKPYYG